MNIEEQQTMIYAMLDCEQGNKRRRGRPRSKCLQEVKEDLARAGITNWNDKVMDRRASEIANQI